MGFLMCSYADESGDVQVYSVCALLGKLEDFGEPGRRWRHALNEEHLAEFHASKLENHLKPYDHPSFDHDRRECLQRKFIGILTDLPIWGFNAFVEKEALAKHDRELAPFVSHREPYTFAFRMLIEIMAIEADEHPDKLNR
jgi:hypothetical protein